RGCKRRSATISLPKRVPGLKARATSIRWLRDQNQHDGSALVEVLVSRQEMSRSQLVAVLAAGAFRLVQFAT
ncbi:MAG TPA: hypothetical protein VK961_19730, partial [Chthoniobacter sp.]|nr:hypothetical protein [Chthoniobacter sp.]